MNQNEKIKLGRTDLAKDEYESSKYQNLKDFENFETSFNQMTVTKNIVGNEASQIIDKKPGIYYTIDLNNADIHDTKTIDDIEHLVAKTLKDLLIEEGLINKKVLIVGLGNINVTPDAIGPCVVDNIVVTRHLAQMNVLSDGFISVCAMSPGVMGTTGIETYDVIESLLSKIDVDYIIAVDALATNSLKRINRTIQMTNTGIKPGAGVNNKRKELSFETLNKPVIAIGVPTVVDATTITIESINTILKHLYTDYYQKDNNLMQKNNDISLKYKKAIFGSFGSLDENEQRHLIQEILTPQGYNLIVTPKEIDVEVDDLSKIIANSINITLHPGLYDDRIE